MPPTSPSSSPSAVVGARLLVVPGTVLQVDGGRAAVAAPLRAEAT